MDPIFRKTTVDPCRQTSLTHLHRATRHKHNPHLESSIHKIPPLKINAPTYRNGLCYLQNRSVIVAHKDQGMGVNEENRTKVTIARIDHTAPSSAPPADRSTRLVSCEKRCIDGLHAGRAGEGPHEPVVDAILVVDVHTGQEAHHVPYGKLHHADHTFLGFLAAAIVHPHGQVVDETQTLGDLYLFFLGQLVGCAGDVGRRVVHQHTHGLRLLIWWWGSYWLWLLLHSHRIWGFTST